MAHPQLFRGARGYPEPAPVLPLAFPPRDFCRKAKPGSPAAVLRDVTAREGPSSARVSTVPQGLTARTSRMAPGTAPLSVREPWREVGRACSWLERQEAKQEGA